MRNGKWKNVVLNKISEREAGELFVSTNFILSGIPFFSEILYNSLTSEKAGSIPYLEDAHLRDGFRTA